MKIKIATFNIESGMSLTNSLKHFLFFWRNFLPHSSKPVKKAADFINNEKIDIISFNEIDNGSFRSKDQFEIINKGTNLKENIFFPTYNVLGIANQGNSIHSKYPIITHENYRLPGKGEPRYLGKAVISLDKEKISFFTTHLSLNDYIRKEQISEIASIIKKEDHPFILAGDFNIKDKNELDELNYQKIEARTYPSWKSERSLDKIFLSNHFKILKSYTPNLLISDHLPLVAEVLLEA